MSGETSSEEKVYLHSMVSFHMGRRTHSSIGVHGGIDPMTISKQMGHSGLDMTSRYVGRDDDKLKGMFGFLNEKEREEVKGEVNQEKVEMTPKEVDKELKLLKSRYNRKLITKKVYEDRMRELLK
jgi:hypothetical protein